MRFIGLLTQDTATGAVESWRLVGVAGEPEAGSRPSDLVAEWGGTAVVDSAMRRALRRPGVQAGTAPLSRALADHETSGSVVIAEIVVAGESQAARVPRIRPGRRRGVTGRLQRQVATTFEGGVVSITMATDRCPIHDRPLPCHYG